MKTEMKTIILIASLLLLSACGGGQQTSTSLEISKSFAVTNPSYGGGLVVSGKNLTTGQNFSVGLIGKTTVNYSLDAGNWIFTAVGWDGGGSVGTEKSFAGKPYCGIVQQELSGASATVGLTLSEATCATPAFAGTLPSGAAGKYSRKLKAITSCNTFFDGPLAATDIISSKMVNAATSLTYCESLADDLQTDIESIKIYSLNKGPYELVANTGIPSGCMSNSVSNVSVIYSDSVSPTNPYGTTYDLRLPLRGVPFIIMAYRDSACTEPLARYVFQEGLLPKTPGFDHLLLDNNGNNDEVKLILPGGDMKRALSPLAHLLPYFKQGNGNRFPTEASVSEEFQAFVGSMNKMIIDEATCGAFGTHSNVDAAPAPTCADLGEKIEVAYQPTAAGSGYVNINSQNFYFHAETSAGSQRLLSNRILWNMIGPTDPTMGKERFYANEGGDRESDYGILSEIRNMFSANGAGGVLTGFDQTLSFEHACLDYVTDKTINIFSYEKMATESYKVRIHNSKISSPTPFFADTSSRDASVPTKDYDKRMIIWDYQKDIVNPVMVLEFSCSELVGTIERKDTFLTPTGKESEKSIVHWNTTALGGNLINQRFEMLQHQQSYDLSGNLIKDRRFITRTDKLPGGTSYANWHYFFESSYNAGTWTEIVKFYDQVVDLNKVCYETGSASGTYGSIDGIFGDGTHSTLRVRIPSSVSNPGTYYFIDGSYPQPTSAGACTSTLPSFGDSNGGNYANGTLLFELHSLSPSFASEFGTSFFTAP